MKIIVAILLACQVLFPSTDAAHHESPDLGATAATFFSDFNVPEKPTMVQARPTKTIAPVKTNSQEMQSESRPKNSMPPVVDSNDDEAMTHMHIEDARMEHEMEDEVMLQEMIDEAMAHEMKTDGSSSSTIIDQQQENDGNIQEPKEPYDQFHDHDSFHGHNSEMKMLGMDLEGHMEMHHSNDHGKHAHLALLPHLVLDDSVDIEMHDSDQHNTPQPNGQSTYMTDIKTSPMSRLNANTVQYMQPIKYSYNKPTTGYVPQMVMRMSSNVYKPQMNNRHYSTGRKQYSTNGYGKSQSYQPQMNNRRYGTGRKQYNTGYGKKQDHYYYSLNNL